MRVDELVSLLEDLRGENVQSYTIHNDVSEQRLDLPFDHLVLASAISPAHMRKLMDDVIDLFKLRLKVGGWARIEDQEEWGGGGSHLFGRGR